MEEEAPRDDVLNAKETITEEETQELLHKSEMSLILTSYDDIFSDFDPRNSSQRALSQDFLDETKRASRDKSFEGIEIELLIPHNKRNDSEEATIKKRLHDHFRRHHSIIAKEVIATKKDGKIRTVVGIAMMFAAIIIPEYSLVPKIVEKIFFILLEPGGWFFFWTGLEILFSEWKRFKPELDFYEKMSRAKFKFNSY